MYKNVFFFQWNRPQPSKIIPLFALSRPLTLDSPRIHFITVVFWRYYLFPQKMKGRVLKAQRAIKLLDCRTSWKAATQDILSSPNIDHNQIYSAWCHASVRWFKIVNESNLKNKAHWNTYLNSIHLNSKMPLRDIRRQFQVSIWGCRSIPKLDVNVQPHKLLCLKNKKTKTDKRYERIPKKRNIDFLLNTPKSFLRNLWLLCHSVTLVKPQ